MSSCSPTSSYQDQKQSLKMSTSTRNSIPGWSESPHHSPLQHHGGRSWKRTFGKWEYDDGYELQPVRLFRHWKSEPQEAGIWPTLKDIIFTLIVSAGVVMVLNEILSNLASTFFTGHLYWFEKIAFWLQWKVCMRWSVVGLWLAKIIFDAGTVLGRLDAQRKPNRPSRSSFRSQL